MLSSWSGAVQGQSTVGGIYRLEDQDVCEMELLLTGLAFESRFRN